MSSTKGIILSNLNFEIKQHEQLNKDIATLESIQCNIHSAISHGGVDKLSLSVVNVLQQHMSKKYNIDTVTLSTENATPESDTVSMERIGELLTKAKTSAVAVAKAIWAKIIKFINWVTQIIPIRRMRLKQQSDKLDAYNKALNDTARIIRSGKIPPALQVDGDDEMIILVAPAGAKSVMIPDLVQGDTVSGSIDKMSEREKVQAERGARSNRIAKKKVLKAEQELNKQEVDKKIRENSLSSQLGEEGKSLSAKDLEHRIVAMAKIDRLASRSMADKFSEIIYLLKELISTPGMVIMSDTTLHKEIPSIKTSIIMSLGSIWSRGGTLYNFPGLVNNIAELDKVSETGNSTYFSASKCVFRIEMPPLVEPYELPALSSKQISSIRKLQIAELENSKEEYKRYGKLLAELKHLFDRIEQDRLSTQDDYGVIWLREWTYKLASVVSTSSAFHYHYNKLIDNYIAMSIKAIGE